MTDTLAPLTSAELADLKAKAKADRADDFTHLDIPIPTILRLIDMIERWDAALNEIAMAGENGLPPDYNSWLQFHERIARMAREALAATEPPK